MTRYTCEICKAPINKNHESFRGRMTMSMVRAIKENVPNFHPKDDICKPCGERFAQETAGAGKPAWMDSPLG